MKVDRRTAGLLAFVALAALPLRAQDGPVETRLEARKVVRAEGRESFIPAENVRPGDVIEYVATYRNKADAAVRSLEATLPIPAHTELLPESIKPAGARASLDAASFAALPLKRGKELVPAREYRYLRWHVARLDPRQSVSFSARVRVLDEP